MFLRSLIAQVEQVSGVTYDPANAKLAPAFRVLLTTCAAWPLLFQTEYNPANIDRGYVLRKVLRRAVRYGRMLGMEDPFLPKCSLVLLKRWAATTRNYKKDKAVLPKF